VRSPGALDLAQAGSDEHKQLGISRRKASLAPENPEVDSELPARRTTAAHAVVE
jgi:hypothetical protein